MIIQKVGSVAAGALGTEEGAYLAGRREQCFIGGVRWRLRIPACPNVPRGGRPLSASSTQSPLSRELPVLRLTTGIARDPQVTRWQAVRTRSVDCAYPAAPTADLR